MNSSEVSQYLELREENTIFVRDGSVRDGVAAWGGVGWQNNATRKRLIGFAGMQGRSISLWALSEAYEDNLFILHNPILNFSGVLL